MPAASFAPVYRLQPQQHLIYKKRQQPARHKRKHDADDEPVSAADASVSSEDEQLASVRHPVNKKDPYYVAGYAREQSLPPAPFPAAQVKTGPRRKVNVQQELAKIKPPILTQAGQADDSFTSLKHRHLDNLVALLHTRILKQDWGRASRIFGLLLRTDVSDGIDIRKNERWKLAGEILLHHDQREDGISSAPSCQSARQLYERLILNYPYRQRLQSKVTEANIYPALFNVWIYEVQHRSTNARQASSSTDQTIVIEPVQIISARRVELDEATEIADRMDKLRTAPPFDNDQGLLRLRAMIAQWITDICEALIALTSTVDDIGNQPDAMRSPHAQDNDYELEQWRRRAGEERLTSQSIFDQHDVP